MGAKVSRFTMGASAGISTAAGSLSITKRLIGASAGTSTVSDAREKLRQVAKKFVITLGANGALIYDGDTFINIEPYKVGAVDSNGAGDMFSGAFLYGITHRHSFAEAGKLASLASSRVVTQFGPRLDILQARKILQDLAKH